MKTPILGASYTARSINAANNRMINLYPEVVLEGGKEAGFLTRCPCTVEITSIGDGPIRGMRAFGGVGYIVSGSELYSVTEGFVATFLGNVSGTGPVSMSDNGTQLFIACNPDSYIYNSSTAVFQKITDPDFPGAVTVGYLDGYFVFNEPDTQKVWVTSLYDGTSVDPLDFASAEGSPDNLVAVAIDHREAWLFGETTTEVWYNAGLVDFPLSRIQGAFVEIGCVAPYSIAKLDNTLFWLGKDERGSGIVYRANGYSPQRISTHAIEYALQGYSTIKDAISFSYQQEGHSFYVIVFPTAEKTWAFDVSTGQWHERAMFTQGVFTRHRANAQMNFSEKVVIGDYSTGVIYYLDLNSYEDSTGEQKWLRSWRALGPGQNNLQRAAHHSLQIDCETGVGLNTGQGSDPVMFLRWSDDGGHNWSNVQELKLGKIGETSARAIKRRLGTTEKLRDRVYEISGTDPVKISIMGAELMGGPKGS
ncbi:hypothetical protein [Sulfurovum sp.]|uniref:hypothetical protein n=1 Tax=Sulfurovum sp. TaxID=1969726 RepID=UPI003564C735